MTSRRLILVSDLHLGGGAASAAWGPGFVDEFNEDAAFSAFLAYLRRREGGRCRLVLLGDTVDFLRVPVTGRRNGLYARDDREAIGQLEQIHAAHSEVFGGLAALLAAGAPVDVVLGNHDVELARPAVRDRLRALLSQHAGAALDLLRFHPWALHLPGLLYAEHGNHYHDINTFVRPLCPFRRNGLVERPPGARLGALRRAVAGGRARPCSRDAIADLQPRRRLDPVSRAEYRGSVLPAYSAELGLPLDTVVRLHQLGQTSVPRIARRMLRAWLAGGRSFGQVLPTVAAAVHQELSASGHAAAFYVFGHVHAARHVWLPGTDACYLNTGTWSTDRREPPDGPEPAEPVGRTWVEIDPGQDGIPPKATLWTWAGAPDPLPGPLHPPPGGPANDRA
jgi:UDP-2,3-diacylglucosamine pyrophosphatase LpxH